VADQWPNLTILITRMKGECNPGSVIVILVRHGDTGYASCDVQQKDEQDDEAGGLRVP
jgi:hypothetical protein